MESRYEKSGLKASRRGILLMAAALFYIVRYLSFGGVPGPAKNPIGWWANWDQGLYLKSAQALANFDFSPQLHWFPLGYPMMGAFFCKLLPVNPFLVPDILFFLLITSALYLIFRKFLSGVESIVLVILTVFLPHVMMRHLIIPWTTIPVHALTYVIIYLLIFREYKEKNFIISSLLTGVIFLTRPGDILFVLPIFVFSVIAAKDTTKIVRTSFRSLLVFLPFVIAGILANKFIYGVYWSTPYIVNNRSNGFSPDHILYKAYSIFIEAGSLYSLTRSMLFLTFPWILFVVPGTFYMYKKMGLRVAGLILSIMTAYLFCLSYNDFDAKNLFNFGTIHYLVWTFPLLALPAYLTFRDAWKGLSWKCYVPAAMLPVLAAAFTGAHFVDVKWAGNINLMGNKAKVGAVDNGNIGTGWSYDYQGGDNKLAEITFNSPETFDAIQLSGWPKGNEFFDENIVLFIDGRRLSRASDYRQIFKDEDAVFFFHHRITNARSLTLGVKEGYRGRVSLSEFRPLRAELTAGGEAVKALRRLYYASVLKEAPRSNWTARASSGEPMRALDNNRNTRWSTGRPQKPGDFFEVDLGEVRRIFRISLELGPDWFDYPRGYTVELSLDGTKWETVKRVDKTVPPFDSVFNISFAPAAARMVKITQTGISSDNYWAIREIHIFEP